MLPNDCSVAWPAYFMKLFGLIKWALHCERTFCMRSEGQYISFAWFLLKIYNSIDADGFWSTWFHFIQLWINRLFPCVSIWCGVSWKYGIKITDSSMRCRSPAWWMGSLRFVRCSGNVSTGICTNCFAHVYRVNYNSHLIFAGRQTRLLRLQNW